MYQVQKKDGRLEAFDRSKLIRGALAAGATTEEAEKVATGIEAWLPTAEVDGVVRSADLRTKSLELLREVNPAAATSFEAYKKV
jgi:transcriptional regulator NrdR family protein